VKSNELADRLVADTVEHLGQAVRSLMPRFRLPGSYGGHPVGADVRADLAFTLGLLWQDGVRSVAGIPIEEALQTVLFPVDGDAVHTFFSYRIAETLARFGPIAANSLLATASQRQLDQLILACDATAAASALRAGRMSRNYAAVLARCEVARQNLGLPCDVSLRDEMLERTSRMLAKRIGRFDDSHSGNGRYDLYTADIYLFCEPLSRLLAPTWERGAREMLELVTKVACEDGSAMTWGRSAGALGVCHTVELGALALGRGLTEDPAMWLALAVNARQALRKWFCGGVTTAHQHRSADRYRGPERRLQLTFDILGKLVDAVRHLRVAAPVVAASWAEAFPLRDEIVWFDQDAKAFVWSYRSEHVSFVLPVSGCTVSDYLPAPRRPGLLEGQVGGEQAVAVPFVSTPSGRHVGAGLPAEVNKFPGSLRLVFEGWPAAGDFDGPSRAPLAGRREVTFSVEGATLRATEALEFSRPPLAVGLQIAEAQRRPLRVAYECPSPSAACVVDTAGIAEWRSFWGELPVVHQLDLEPARSLTFTWRVTPLLRVLTSVNAFNHHYHRTLYDTLAEEVAERCLPEKLPPEDAELNDRLRGTDVFHQHWPEWFPGLDLAAHHRLIAALRRAEIPILWTMHNLGPHRPHPQALEIYRAWARVADGVVHHSAWGREQALAHYRFRDDAVHRVVPHPHFGHLVERRQGDRERVEHEFGLRKGALRLGIVGAPRRDKRIDLVVEAVRACRRADLELLILSLGPEEEVAQDPRIRAWRYERVARAEYDLII
jgi:hypothetical protein